MTLRSYYNGEELSQADPRSVVVPFSSVGGIVTVQHRCDPGERTTQAVVITCVDADYEIASSSSGPWGTSVNLGYVGDSDASTYHRQKTVKPVGSAAAEFLSVVFSSVEAVADTTAPVMVSQPVSANVDNTSFDVIYDASDNVSADEDLVHKLAVKTTDSFEAGDFQDATPVIDFPFTINVSGKDANTTYYVRVRVYDEAGNYVESDSLIVATLASSNNPPEAFTPEDATHYITTGSIVGSGTGGNSGSVTVEAATEDPEADPLTYKVTVTTSATQPNWSVVADRTAAAMAAGIVIGNLTAGTRYVHVQARDSFGAAVWGYESVVIPDTTAPGNVGGFAATAGNTVVDLAWSAVTDNVAVTGYRLKWGLAADALNNTIDLGVVASYQHTGRENDTPYYYSIEAVDAALNYSATPATANATPTGAVEAVWEDDFADGSVNSTLWGLSQSVSGAAAEESGQFGAVVTGFAARPVTDRWVVWGKTAIPVNTPGTLVIETIIPDTAASVSALFLADTAPVSYSSVPATHSVSMGCYGPSAASNAGKPYLRYYDTGGTARYWDHGTQAWVTDINTALASAPFAFGLGDTGTWKVEIDYANARLRLVVTDGTTTFTSGWVALSGIRGSGTNRYAYLFDTSTSYNYPIRWASMAYYAALV